MSEKRQKIIFISLLIGIIIFGIYQNTSKHNNLEKEGEIVNGEIIDFKFVYKATYKITYKYTIENIDYTASTRTSYFECDNGKKGCVGSIFKIKYFPNNPEISEILLEKYEGFKKSSPHL